MRQPVPSLAVTVKSTSYRFSHPYTYQTARAATMIDGTALRMQLLTMHESLPDSTFATKPLDMDSDPRLAARPAVCALLVFCLLHRCLRYFTSELPPFRSGLKRPSGPWSTLPYLWRIHDVDRMRAWIAMKEFSDQFHDLFAMILAAKRISGWQGRTLPKACLSKTLLFRPPGLVLRDILTSLKTTSTCHFLAAPKRFTVKSVLRAHSVTGHG